MVNYIIVLIKASLMQKPLRFLRIIVNVADQEVGKLVVLFARFIRLKVSYVVEHAS